MESQSYLGIHPS